MLDNARKYIDVLKNKFLDIWYDNDYKYYFCNDYHNSIELPDNDFNEMHFVSLDSSYNVIGYISYSVHRGTNSAYNLGIMNFSKDNKFIFGKDVYKVIDDIFTKFNMQRLEFSVVVGNPIEKSYDRMIEKYNGRIVGIRKRAVKLADNKLYDEKIYELLNEDYLSGKI